MTRVTTAQGKCRQILHKCVLAACNLQTLDRPAHCVSYHAHTPC